MFVAKVMCTLHIDKFKIHFFLNLTLFKSLLIKKRDFILLCI